MAFIHQHHDHFVGLVCIIAHLAWFRFHWTFYHYRIGFIYDYWIDFLFLFFVTIRHYSHNCTLAYTHTHTHYVLFIIHVQFVKIASQIGSRNKFAFIEKSNLKNWLTFLLLKFKFLLRNHCMKFRYRFNIFNFINLI